MPAHSILTIMARPETVLLEKPKLTRVRATRRHAAVELNRVATEDRAVHDWYRFVLSYPPHLVRDYVRKFGLTTGQRLLDPFCGTGTTIVEAKKLGIASVGIEAHPLSHFASATEVDGRKNKNGRM